MPGAFPNLRHLEAYVVTCLRGIVADMIQPPWRQSSRHPTLWIRIAIDVLVAIVEGDLRPGDRLPPHISIGEAYGCHRDTARNAMLELAHYGVVIREKRHQGTHVASGATERAKGLVDAGFPPPAHGVSTDVEVARPGRSYDVAWPRTEVVIDFDHGYEWRRSTMPEVDAGRFGVDELVVDAVGRDGTVQSYGLFHTTFRLAPELLTGQTATASAT